MESCHAVTLTVVVDGDHLEGLNQSGNPFSRAMESAGPGRAFCSADSFRAITGGKTTTRREWIPDYELRELVLDYHLTGWLPTPLHFLLETNKTDGEPGVARLRPWCHRCERWREVNPYDGRYWCNECRADEWWQECSAARR